MKIRSTLVNILFSLPDLHVRNPSRKNPDLISNNKNFFSPSFHQNEEEEKKRCNLSESSFFSGNNGKKKSWLLLQCNLLSSSRTHLHSSLADIPIFLFLRNWTAETDIASSTLEKIYLKLIKSAFFLSLFLSLFLSFFLPSSSDVSSTWEKLQQKPWSWLSFFFPAKISNWVERQCRCHRSFFFLFFPFSQKSIDSLGLKVLGVLTDA